MFEQISVLYPADLKSENPWVPALSLRLDHQVPREKCTHIMPRKKQLSNWLPNHLLNSFTQAVIPLAP
jgi:hypothetical protein